MNSQLEPAVAPCDFTNLDVADFRAIFQSVPGLYLVLTLDFKIVAVSDAYLRATMTQREEILGRGIFEVFPDNPGDPMATGVRNLLASLRRVMHERQTDSMAVQKYDILRPASEGGGFEVRYWSPVNSPVLGPTGEVQYIIHRVEDVTEFVRLRQRETEQDLRTQSLLSRSQQMEAEIFFRAQEIQVVNHQLQEKNEELINLQTLLEHRVYERTAELAEVNEALQAEVLQRRHNELLLKSVLDNTFDAIVSITDRGVIETFNGAAERMFGYASRDIVGQNVKLLMPEPHRAQHDGYIARYLRTGEAHIIGTERELIASRADGTTFPIELTVTETPPDSTGRRHFIGMIRDLTWRKQAEEHQARLVEVLEATPDFVGLADTNLNPIFLNRAGRTMACIGVDEDIAHTKISDYFTEASAQLIINEGIPRALADGTWMGETVLRTRQGQDVPVSQVIVAHKMAGGEVRFLSTMMRDLREQKRLEVQLRQSQKLEAFGQLSGGVAHDFNNILTVISGYCECLKDDTSLKPDSREMIAEIHKAGDRAAALTRQLLAFSRQQVLQPNVLNLNEVITETGKMLGRLIGEDVLLTTKMCATLWPVKVDAGQIEQVLMNLAVNARDAMPEGGSLNIETDNVVLDPSYAETHVDVKPGRYVVMSVSDTGCGMDTKTQARIFEPFFTTKAPGKGTGLGLATVFGIVKQSGGHISVYSEPAHGTTFRIYLPKDETVAESRHLEKNSRPSVQGTETVLVVEDEPVVRSLASRILRSHGYHVLEAGSGSEALVICEAQSEKIQLVLTDVVMPEMNGRQLADQLRDSKFNLQVLFMSGYTDDSIVRRGILEADANFIQKPFSPAGLLLKVREVLDNPGPQDMAAGSRSGITRGSVVG